jgi:CRP/FNR family transcriptional regulator, cyclic AMP receptor protein
LQTLCNRSKNNLVVDGEQMDSYLTEKRRFSKENVAELLLSSNALTQLDMADAKEIVAYMESKRIKPQGIVLQEGFSNTGFLALILQGQAVVENEFTKRTDSLVITTLDSGALIGELGLIDGLPRSATVRAVTELDLAVLERGALTRLMNEKPSIACRLLANVLATLATRLRTANQKIRILHAINRSIQDDLRAYNASGLQPLS